MKALKMALLLILIFFIIVSASNVKSLDDSNCSDFEFIFARGSGQSLNDSDYKAYETAILEKLPSQNISFYELGENGYPAVSIDFAVSLGAIVSAGESYQFGASVEKGVNELINHIKTESNHCKNKQFVLAGYSQGAVVIDKTLNYLNPEKIFYVANFGDPKLYLPEGKRACKNLGLSDYRVYVPDCNVEEGILDGIKPYQPAGYRDKLGVWCNQTDIICGSNLNIINPLKGHLSYNSKNGYEKFADLIFDKIEHKSKTPTVARYSDSKKRDIAIIYDFSQMSNYEFRRNGKSIEDDLKARLVELANHGTRIAIYNSYNLQTPIKYLERKVEFTNDDLGAKIDRYNEENKLFFGYIFGSGNNIFSGVKKVIKTADWSSGSEKNIFILSNSAHSDDISYDGTGYEDVIEFAKANDVKISIISINHSEDNCLYQEVVKSTGGTLIGDDYSKIALNKNTTQKLFTKTFSINQDSKYTVVVINGAVYGLSDKKSITITNLNRLRENSISFISYNAAGKKQKVETINFYPAKIKAPNTGTL